jgi:flagellum-specific peptidoglycan hydrolase FlgJ
MNKRRLIPLLMILVALAAFGGFARRHLRHERGLRYVSVYKNLAEAEQRRADIPAAVTLAQGILESDAGATELAIEAKNHFGIKCGRDWTGARFWYKDEGSLQCFRSYASVADSYCDHSDFLASRPRYRACFALDLFDAAGWARELKRAGYATHPRYAERLTRIMEEFNLQDVTRSAQKSEAAASAPPSH